MINQKILFILGLVVMLGSVQAQQALVRSYDQAALSIGQAYLVRYGKECLALMPTHVAKEANYNPSLLGSGRDPLLGEAVDISDLGSDLSVTAIKGSLSQECGFSITTLSRAIDKHVQKNGMGTLRSVNGDGTIANMSVAIVDNDGKSYLRIQPTNSNQQIRKGQSGSLLIANEQPVGILLSVSSRRGIGKVLRFDTLLNQIEEHMAKLQKRKDPNAVENMQGDSKDLAAAVNGGEVLAWSVVAVDLEHRATNLIADQSVAAWQGRAGKWPVEIEIDLGGEKRVINRIVLAATGILDQNSLPKRIEIFLNINSDEKHWRSLTSRTIRFDEDGEVHIKFAPSWARQVKLSIGEIHGASNVISLSRIHIFGP